MLILFVIIMLLPLVHSCAGKAFIENPACAQQPHGTIAVNNAWPSGLPQDAVQTWEQLDPAGYVVPGRQSGNGRIAAGINGESEFRPGVERYTESGECFDLGEASHLASGAPGEGGLGCAVYRLLMAGRQPGVISTDINLLMSDAGPGSYWVGVSDYGRDRWQWRGPFSDSHVRLSLPESDYLSSLGNLFICVVAHDGAAFDIVGIGAAPRDPDDSTPPQPPLDWMPVLTPVQGGVQVDWLAATAGDLAGYRVYYGPEEFMEPSAAAGRVDYLVGSTRHILAGLEGEAWIALTAVDTSGNESVMSLPAAALPLPGEGPRIELLASQPSGLLGDEIILAAGGAEVYDWDTDGDGFFDITGDTSGSVGAHTGATGIIRPRVRGIYGEASCVAEAAVSLIIAGNSRPVASGYALPASGPAPLPVMFTGIGDDPGGEIIEYAWDFDGNGSFDWADPANPNPPFSFEFQTPGIYNAKFRVEDNQGAWDVDTVTVLVEPGTEPNDPPVAALSVDFAAGAAPHTVLLDAAASHDPDGTIMLYEWDYDGDGTYESSGTSPTANHTYTTPGEYNPAVLVTDDDGAQDVFSVLVTANGWRTQTIHALDGRCGDAEMLIADGNPAMVFIDYTGTTQTLKYVRANDNIGTSWGSAAVLATFDSNYIDQMSAAVVASNPAVAYRDDTAPSERIMYIAANDAAGAGWQASPTVVQNTGNSFGPVSLADVGGVPAIAYAELLSGDMDTRYIRATDAAGTAWGIPQSIINTTDNEGTFISLAMIYGNPAVAIYNYTDSKVEYRRADDTAGTSWTGSVAVVADGGYYVELTEVFSSLLGDNVPAVIFHSLGPDLQLEYCEAQDSTGSFWSLPGIVDPLPGTGYHCSFTFNQSVSDIWVAYNAAYEGDLRVNRGFPNSSGGAWEEPRIIDSAGDTGEFSTVVLLNNTPAIGYVNSTADTLKFAYLY